MSDELLEFYNSELNYFRRLTDEFAKQHPKIAGRLRLEKPGEDPHVSRLVESFAFLNARLRLKLEDEFPELCQAFLSVLYPEYLNPIPSFGIVGFQLPPSQFGLKSGFTVNPKTELTTEPIDGEPCRFRTSYPVQLWPIKVVDAGVQSPPFIGPPTTIADRAKGVARIKLSCFSDQMAFDQLSLTSLRFFLKGESRYVYDLYELLLNNAIGIAVAGSDDENEPVILPPESISPVGFEVEDALLDYSARSRLGFHLLTEFCTFPQKFLFFDVALDQATLARAGKGSDMNLYIYLDEMPRNLENNIPPDTFCLGATPIVNLFEKRAEPIALKHTKGEHRVVPDARRALANEVYSINRVVSNFNGNDVDVFPFYSVNHPGSDSDSNLFWYSTRRNVEVGAYGKDHQLNLGTDVYLNLIGLNGKIDEISNKTLDVYTTCLNRNFPNELPRGTQFNLSGGNAMVQSTLLLHPTETKRPRLTDQMHWRLISHLSLNHMTLVDDSQGATSLKEMLRLYNFTNSRGVEMMIDGLNKSETRRIVGRVGGRVSSGFCKGTEIKLTIDETKFSGGGEYLFGSILDRFLAMFTSINSFTQTVVETKQGKSFNKWPLRSGDTELL
ncbi:MAG: type VI secretion system baseplate subunit TssF [Mariniblastus sp.]|nr:type VI secretion system baseplate subunit TssF [Mariniblastus sp.]